MSLSSSVLNKVDSVTPTPSLCRTPHTSTIALLLAHFTKHLHTLDTLLLPALFDFSNLGRPSPLDPLWTLLQGWALDSLCFRVGRWTNLFFGISTSELPAAHTLLSASVSRRPQSL